MRALLLCVLVAGGCADHSLSVTVVDAAPLTLDPASPGGSDLTVKVRYHDGDGNLGGGRALLRDCRGADLVTELALPPIASEAAVQAGVPIEGELDLTVQHVGAVDAPSLPDACAQLGVSLAAGQTVFCVELEDAAGTRSNGACTGPIAIAD
jgi:hypothetical protein